VCEQHEEILDRACKKCDRLICNECDVYGTDCTGIIKYYPSDYHREIKISIIYSAVKKFKDASLFSTIAKFQANFKT